MAVGVEVRVTVGDGVKVALGTSVAVAVENKTGAGAPAQPARSNNMTSRLADFCTISLLFRWVKIINFVVCVFVHNMHGRTGVGRIISLRYHVVHSVT